MNWGNGMDWPQFMQNHPMLGQRFQHLGGVAMFGQHQPTGGYDSSGINPHGMYNQGGPLTPPIGQPQFPANPGGFQPMGGLAGMFNRYRGG